MAENLLLSDYETRSDNIYGELVLSDNLRDLSIVDEKIAEKDDDDNYNYLDILVLGPILTGLLKLIQGYDIITFLSSCKALLNSNGWGLLLIQLEITTRLIELIPPEKRINNRISSLFIINQLGYSCSCCLKPLDGSEGSLFACNNHHHIIMSYHIISYMSRISLSLSYYY